MNEQQKNAIHKNRARLAKEPLRTPYGAYVDFLLKDDCQLEIDKTTPLDVTDRLVEIGLTPDQPLGPMSVFKSYRVSITGFDSATAAEANGSKLASAILWVAISKRFSLLVVHPGVNICTVYDRTQDKGGLTCRAHVTGFFKVSSHELSELMQPILSSKNVSPALLLSMELFASSRFELTEQARFIAMVSSLEPLAAPQELPETFAKFVSAMASAFDSRFEKVTSDRHAEKNGKLKASLRDRIMGLKTESIRQALLRTVESVSPTDPQLWKTIDEAYSLRSKILHDGLKEPYLNSWITRAECAIRKIYAGILNLPLSTPPFNDQ